MKQSNWINSPMGKHTSTGQKLSHHGDYSKQIHIGVVTESRSHFAKRLSDLKQNGTQEKTPFSGRVFHTLSHGVLRFVESVSFKNHWIEAPWLAAKELQPVRKWFFELTLATKRITPCERVLKTVLENGVFSCVPFWLRSLRSIGHFDETETMQEYSNKGTMWYYFELQLGPVGLCFNGWTLSKTNLRQN